MRKLVGANVRDARLAAGLTQEELAERSGFSQQYISGLERGRRNPTIVSIFEIGQALGVSHEQLVAADAANPMSSVRVERSRDTSHPRGSA